jgi:phosphatidylglycerophosphate synthase
MIIGRDLLIFFGGIFLSNKLGRVLPSNMLGKITVLVIGFVIIFIMLQVDRESFLFKTFYIASLILIVGSFIGYAIRASEFLKGKKYGSV